MRMIRAIIRPEKEHQVVDELEKVGFVSLTKIDVYGRGKQAGIKVDNIHYEELPKTMIMLVVPEAKTDEAINIIAQTSKTGSFGDGKIFVTEVTETYTVRTGETVL